MIICNPHLSLSLREASCIYIMYSYINRPLRLINKSIIPPILLSHSCGVDGADLDETRWGHRNYNIIQWKWHPNHPLQIFFDQNSINKKLLAQKEVSFHKNMKIASRCQLDGRQVIATHPSGGKKFFFWHDLVCGGSTIIRKKWAHFKRAPYP
jgi:hypothetical protein